MKLLDDLALKRKITGSFVIVFMSFLLIGAVIYQSILEIQQLNHLIELENKTLSFVHQTRQNNLGLRYRATRLYGSTKVSTIKAQSDKYKEDALEINSDLAIADSIYSLILNDESDELNQLTKNGLDSTLYLVNKIMLPSVINSLEPMRAYVDTYLEFDDYLDRYAVSASEIRLFRSGLDDLKDRYESHADDVFAHYATINRLVKEVRDGLEESISSHQIIIQEIISRTRITVVATIGIALMLIALVNAFLNRIIIPPVQKVAVFLTEFAEGKFPDIELKETGDEIGLMAKEINKLKSSLEASTSFANAIRVGDFDEEFIAKDALGQSLVGMRESLKKSNTEENARKFMADGLNQLNQVLTEQSDTIAAFGDNLLHCIIGYLNFQVGGFYVVHEKNEKIAIEMEACFAFDRKKYIKKIIEPGQGIVGQAYLEKEPVYLEEIPQDFMDVTSGLGDAPPTSICVIPLLHNEKTHGLLEFASLNKMIDTDRHFLEEAANTIASVLSSRIINKKTEQLLEETQKKTSELQSQEEEMRQNMEELQATQEAMSRNENRSKAILEKISEPIITFDVQGIIGTVNSASCNILGYSAQELEGENIEMLTSDHQSIHAYMDNDSALTIRGKEVTFKTKNGHFIQLYLNIDEFMLETEKIFVCSLKKGLSEAKL